MPKKPTVATYVGVVTRAEDGVSRNGSPYVVVDIQLNNRGNEATSEWEPYHELVDQFYSLSGGAVQYSVDELVRLGVTYSDGQYILSGESVQIEEYEDHYNGETKRKFRPASPPRQPVDDVSRAIIGNAFEVAAAKAALNATNTETPTAPPAAGAQTKDDLPF